MAQAISQSTSPIPRAVWESAMRIYVNALSDEEPKTQVQVAVCLLALVSDPDCWRLSTAQLGELAELTRHAFAPGAGEN